MAGSKNAKTVGITVAGLLVAVAVGSILDKPWLWYAVAFFATLAFLYLAGVFFAGFFKPVPKSPGVKDNLKEQAKHRPVEMEPFWMPGIYTYYGDWYQWAITHNQTADFLLGEGVYRMPQDHREWCGQHEPHNAFRHLEQYASTHGNQKMLEMLANDIQGILYRVILSAEHFYFVLRYIELYFEAHAAGRLATQWMLSPPVRQGIAIKAEKFMQLYGTDGGPFECNTPRNEYYTQQALFVIGRIKEKFGVALLYA